MAAFSLKDKPEDKAKTEDKAQPEGKPKTKGKPKTEDDDEGEEDDEDDEDTDDADVDEDEANVHKEVRPQGSSANHQMPYDPCVQLVDNLKARLTSMEKAIVYLWNQLSGDQFANVRTYLQQYLIPDHFSKMDDGGEEEEEEVLDEESVIDKRIYLCGKCKKHGHQVPKKGHVCPYKAN